MLTFMAISYINGFFDFIFAFNNSFRTSGALYFSHKSISIKSDVLENYRTFLLYNESNDSRGIYSSEISHLSLVKLERCHLK